jgi:hypothetical protein
VPPRTNGTGSQLTAGSIDTDHTWRLVSSRAVCWWEVNTFVAPLLARVGSWPMAGSVAWCALADDHPAKWAALLDAAQHWALRVET